MRKLLPAGAMLLAITATAASATPVTFGYTGGFRSYTVPTTGFYNILAFGAQGSSGSFVVGPNSTALVITAGGGSSGGGGPANVTRSGRFVTAGAEGTFGGMGGSDGAGGFGGNSGTHSRSSSGSRSAAPADGARHQCRQSRPLLRPAAPCSQSSGWENV